MPSLRIGLRGSPLSCAQTEEACKALSASHPSLQIELVEVLTSGDSKQGIKEPVTRDKRDWIDNIEFKVVNSEIDLAVHSGKDIPVEIAKETELTPLLKREEARDALILRVGIEAERIQDLPNGARIGTASIRRKAQILSLRPDLQVLELRGNVQTRLSKLDSAQEFDAIVLAAAGLIRLGLGDRISALLDRAEMPPAVNQGILVGQCLRSNQETKNYLNSVVDVDSKNAFIAEREIINALGADCHSAVAAYAFTDKGQLVVDGRVYTPDGSICLKEKVVGGPEAAESLGRTVGDRLLAQGAAKILSDSRELSGLS